MFLCVHCLKENVACTQNGQCCHGQCTYGRCKKDAAPGAPGTFCDRHDDCKDPPGTCCVRLVYEPYFWMKKNIIRGKEDYRSIGKQIDRQAGYSSSSQYASMQTGMHVYLPACLSACRQRDR